MAERGLSGIPEPAPNPNSGHPADPTGGPAFGRVSALRIRCAEPVLFLGAQRALLLQISDPIVAQGVDDHSTFRQLPVTRLWSTADAMLCMVWGSDAQAAAAHRRVMAIHDGINGTLPHTGNRVGYTAHDPSALSWVWGTLVETTFQVHERWLRPLGNSWDDLYADWRRFGVWFGIPSDQLPASTDAFRSWYAERLAALRVTDEARELATSILDPPMWFVPQSVKRAHALVATGLLDPHLRAEFGLTWGQQQADAFERAERRLRVAWASVPTTRRALPFCYIAARGVLIRS